MHAVPIDHAVADGTAGLLPAAQKPAATHSLGAAYGMAVFGWVLSAGVYIAAKWAAPEMPPWALCFWRLALACAILVPIVHRHHADMIDLLKSRAAEVLMIGAIGLTLCQGMIYTGLTYTDATTAGIIMALSPVMTMVLARIVLGESLGPWQGVGAVLALAGMVVIVTRGDPAALARLDLNPGELFVVGSALCWALYTVLLRRSKFQLELLPLLVLLLGAGAVATLPFYAWELFQGRHSTLHMDGILALAYVAGPGGALMYLLYNRSVEALGAGRASMLLYLQAVFVAILAYLLLGESLHDYDMAGAAFIVAGLLLANLIKPKVRKA